MTDPVEWREDPEAALKYARTHNPPRYPLTVPPHWLRCNFVTQAGERCRKGQGHESVPNEAAHELPKTT